MRTKVRLVAQDYTQGDGLDFGETFALVARLEAIRIYCLLAQHKVLSNGCEELILKGKINELVFVEQPPKFEDVKRPNHVYKLSKALYGLNQEPRSWYERLRDFLLSKGFKWKRLT